MTDSGGENWYYLKNNSSVRSKKYNVVGLEELKNKTLIELRKKEFDFQEINFINYV